jgi:hypothetical protein
MSSPNTKAKTDQTQADQVADKAAFHPGAQQDSQPKSQEAAAVQHILTAHKKHPLHQFMQGVYEF